MPPKPGLVTALVAAFLILGALTIPFIQDLNEDRTATETIAVGETADLLRGPNATVDSSNDTQSTISLTDGEAVLTETMQESQNATYEFSRGNVTVTLDDATTSNATITAAYKVTWDQPPATQQVWDQSEFLFVIAILFVFAGITAVALGGRS